MSDKWLVMTDDWWWWLHRKRWLDGAGTSLLWALKWFCGGAMTSHGSLEAMLYTCMVEAVVRFGL